MSLDQLETRVGKVEREQARQGEKLDHLTTVVDKTASGVERLLDREARRGEPLSLKVLAGVASAIAAIAVVGWWLIEHSPSITEIKSRLTDLDHERRGRVTLIEKRLDNPASWTTTTRAPR